MKIAIVGFPTFGGSGAVATDLAFELAKRGHEVHFIGNHVPFRWQNNWQKNITFHLVEDSDHPVLVDSPIYVLELTNKIAEVCRRYDIDVINAHYAVPHGVAAVLAKMIPGTRAKVINTFHGTDVSQFGNDISLKELLAFSLNNADAHTAVAQELATRAENSFGLTQPVNVIYNWATPQKYPASQAKELRDLFAGKGEKLVVHISNFREVKRIQDVIAIYLGIRKKVNAKLLLIGDGPEQRIAHRLIAKNSLMNDVFMLGMQTNISRTLAISDLFLLPSSSEAFSLAALEAMSSGVPVMATEVGGMPEMIEDGVDGFLAPVGDIKTMVTKSLKVLQDKDYHKQVSQAAKDKVATKYTAESIVRQYEELFQSVVGDGDAIQD